MKLKNALCSLALVAALLSTGVAIPATVPYDINHARLVWTYQDGVTPANGFNVKCGAVTGGPYTRITQVPVTTNNVPLASAVGPSGTWYCVVTAYVQTASGPLESQGSNEISFFATAAPSGSIVISITP